MEVVVRGVRLERLRAGVPAIAVVSAETAQIHPPDVDRRAPLQNPLGHHLADSAGAGDPVSAEAGGDEEAANVRRLAHDELAVRCERLGAVDQGDDFGSANGRHARNRLLHEIAEPLPVRRQELVGEIGRDPVEAPGRRRALVPAHEQAADFLTEVHEPVGIAHRRNVARDPVDRLGHEVLMRHRDDRHGEADQPANLVRPDPGRVDDDLARHGPLLGLDTSHLAAVDLDAHHVHPGPDRDPALSGAGGQRAGERRGIDPAVGRQIGGALDPRDAHHGEQIVRLVGRE